MSRVKTARSKVCGMLAGGFEQTLAAKREILQGAGCCANKKTIFELLNLAVGNISAMGCSQ